MKLLFCGRCFDVFKLDYGMRQCKCGDVKGQYINNSEAQVTDNESTISIAIGNGALMNAIGAMKGLQANSKDSATRSDYIEEAKIEYAWVRPNFGTGNPHTKAMP